jgi:hypothetical protein
LRWEVLRCQSCGTLTIALGNQDGGMRLSGHKCAGAWDRVSAFEVPVDALKADVAECIRLYAFKRPPSEPKEREQ